MKIKFLILGLCGLLSAGRATAHFTDGVSLTVNGQTAQRAGNTFSILSACGQNQAIINVTAPPSAIIMINGMAGSTATVNIPAYGDNTIAITVTPPSSSPQSYTLVVNKPILYHPIVEQRWDDVLVVNNNPANNGGYSFTSYKWFRNGIQISADQSISAGPNGELLNPTDVYYVEMISNTVIGIMRTCLSTTSSQW
jgi:hypothetical protein